MAVTPGTPATVDASANNQTLIAEFDSTLACALYLEGTALKARAITVGNPPTVNAEFAVATVSSTGIGIALAPLTSTKVLTVYKKSTGDTIARVLSVSGTTITGGTEKTLTTGALFGSMWLSQMPGTEKCIYAYDDGSDVRAMILTVTGTTVTEGSSVSVDNTEIPHVIRCVAFSETKGIVTWYGGLSTDNEGQTINISGTTITTNTTKVISSTNTETNVNNATFLTYMSATKAIYGLSSQGTTDEFVVLTLSGNTFNVGTIEVFTDGGFDHMHASRQSDTIFVSARIKGALTIEVEQFEITGVSLDELTSLGTGNVFVGSNDLFVWTAPVDSNTIIIHHEDTSSEVLTVDAPTAATLSLPTMTAKMASLSADGLNIYVALLADGAPILTKISTGLASDGTTVFEPGTGDNIGVQCGKFDADVVWVAGNFGGTDTVEKSEDAGSSFDVKDPGTFDPATSFVVGPDSDGRVLVFADAGASVVSSSIQETTDSGTSWEEKNSGLGFVSKAVERLDINVEEIVTGNEAGASDNIHYSPNTGQDLEDYSTGVPTQDVTKLIVS
jgi:hypothetical protein